MNPFDLRGPQFLLFYVALTVVVLAVVRVLQRRNEMRDAPYNEVPWNDPYRLAFLRGGTGELLRVAVVSLVDRGLLDVQYDRMQTTPVGLESAPRKPIEQQLVAYFAAGRPVKDLFHGGHFDQTASEYEKELSRMKLLPDDEMRNARRKLLYLAAAVLIGVSAIKIGVALSRGRTNLAFLIILTFVALVLLGRSIATRRSARGDALMVNVANMFQSLRLRAPQIATGGATTEVVMLAAVFGVTALPKENFRWAHTLFPRAEPKSSSGFDVSGGSSCGSSCGGGCGGGCGGCGG
jgi:uncharacterized protein (TIGR04222 family)